MGKTFFQKFKKRKPTVEKNKPIFRSWGLAKRLEHIRNKEK